MSGSYQIDGPVKLSEEQVLALHQKLRDMRHDVNGRLANIVADEGGGQHCGIFPPV